MEVAMVSATTGALQPVVEKLAALLRDKYMHFKGVCNFQRKEIEFLTRELVAMDAFLLRMSEEEDPDVQSKVWMNEVRELSYDMEDSIDDFMQSGDNKDTRPHGFMEKIKHSLGKMKVRRRIACEIKDMKNQLIEVGERNARYKTPQAFSNTRNGSVDPRALAIFENASKLVGICEPKAEIMKMLMEDDGCVSTERKLKIVSIVGSGGTGKTTLANQVYQELKGHFEWHTFLSVSRNPDIMNILRIILSEVSGQGYASTKSGSIQQLIIKINNSLREKRYFIVVDDIWDVDTWDVIKLAFPMTSSRSKIITTTRVNNVAHSCCLSFSGYIYNIRPLDIVYSRQLFHRRLFNSKENCPSYLEEVSDQILKKCDGLPLAIIAISGLLAGMERTKDLWNQVKDSIGRALERNPSVEGMMKILSLSYFDLPPHLKTCLLYVCIFPEDSVIKRKDLIRRWIGEGFIHRDGRHTVLEIGERCFDELLNRSLIQPVKTNEYGEVKTCRVHDTILDFIISKSIEENFITLLSVPMLTLGTQSKVVRRLSLQVGKQGDSALPIAGMVLSRVRSLNVFWRYVEIPSLEEFRCLRVLYLKHCYQLEEHHLENIVGLFQLRYLNLSKTRIRKLPERIGRLGCLETLEVRGTNVKELPTSIVNLKQLAHIHVDLAVKFPDGIMKMQALETFKDVFACRQPFHFLWGLGHLKNLRHLALHFQGEDANMVRENREEWKAIISSLCKLGTQNLRSLTIWEGSSFLQEHLCMHTLEKLITWYSPVPRVPKWFSSLRNLRQLRLQVEEVKQNDICILGVLPALLILHLMETTGSSEKLRISGEIGFQFLRNFNYCANCHSVDLMFSAGSMPRLEKLALIRLVIVEAHSLDIGIEKLPSLITVECEVIGKCGIIEAVRTAVERTVKTHPNHPALFFRRLRI